MGVNSNEFSSIGAGASMPKPQSDHQSALGRLEERVQELGKNLSSLVLRLEPVSDPRDVANKGPSNEALAPAHPVPAIRDLNRLEGYVSDHLRLVKEAIERLAI